MSNSGQNKSSLKEIFSKVETSIHKWENYFMIYEFYFEKFRGENPEILEIGVQYGGSLKMWKEYFINPIIHGIDINPDCKNLEEENINIHIGSQNNKKFLKDFTQKTSMLDIIIDDGGHTMEQQINSFEILFPKLKEGGIYVVEDIESSYLNMYGGGPKRQGTFVEYSKNLIDSINANHSDFSTLKETWYSKNIEFIHFYNNIIVFKKKSIDRFPVSLRNNSNYTINNNKTNKVPRIKLLLSSIISIVNKLLGYLRLRPLYIGSTSQRF